MNLKQEEFPYKRGDYLGHGAYGEVYEVHYRENNPPPSLPMRGAAKYFRSRDDLSNRKEYETLSIFTGNSYAIQAYAFFEGAYIQETNTVSNVLLMELAEGKSFMQLILDRATHHPPWRPDEQFCRTYFGMMLCALESVHRTGYCHRDVKMENFALTESGKVKLIDFGTATKCKEDQKLNQPTGTCSFWAPECYSQNYNGLKADIFALGVCLFQMWFWAFPFGQKDKATPIQHYFKTLYRPSYISYQKSPDTYFNSFAKGRPIPNGLQDLLSSMFAPEAKRITIGGIRETVWFQKSPKVKEQGLCQYYKQLTTKDSPIIINSESSGDFEARGISNEVLLQYKDGSQLDLTLFPSVGGLSPSSLLIVASPQDFLAALRCMFQPKGKTVKVFSSSCYENYKVDFNHKIPDRVTILATIEHLTNEEPGKRATTGSVCIRMGFSPKDMLVVDIFPEEDTLDIEQFVSLYLHIVSQLKDIFN